MRLQGLAFSIEEGGQGGAVDIRVEYSNLESLVFEGGCQVDCDGAFAHAALAARHCDDLLDAEEVALAIELLLFRLGGKHYLNIAETLSLQLALNQRLDATVVLAQVQRNCHF